MRKKILFFLVVLFFILISDAVLSDWVPGYLQRVLGSSSKMGLMMAVSSIVGLCMDLIFPHVLRQSGVRKLAGGAILGSVIFLLSMFSSTWWSTALILMVGMSAWGVYYELDSFMTQQFVAGATNKETRSSVWSIVGMVRSFAYFLGPLLGGYVAFYGDRAVVLSAGSVLFVAYILFLSLKHPHIAEPQIELDIHSLHIKDEIAYWYSLGRRVWPVLTISLLCGLVDASFWTIGTVLNDTLAGTSMVGGWFLSAYLLPFLFVGVFVARWGIATGKKKWAERSLFLGGLSLCILPFLHSIWEIVFCVFCAGVFLSITWPLADAVYTDLATRAQKGRKHVMGMSAATFSIAYIIGPIVSGILAGQFGALRAFGIMGGFVALIAFVLLFLTPKKLLLPQQEMKSWE